jgi:hypothetical protein
MSRIHILGGNLTPENLFEFKNSIEKLLKFMPPEENKHKFLSNFLGYGTLQLSNLGNFRIDDAKQYEANVNKLFNELVSPIKSKKTDVEHTLFTQVKNKFKSLDILANDESGLSRHQIVPNYPINLEMGLKADFVMKNGVYHVSGVVDFNVGEHQYPSKLKETSFKIMTFMHSKDELKVGSTPDTKCYFVYSATKSIEDKISKHLKLASRHSDDLFNFSSRDDEQRYIALMMKLSGNSLPSVH